MLKRLKLLLLLPLLAVCFSIQAIGPANLPVTPPPPPVFSRPAEEPRPAPAAPGTASPNPSRFPLSNDNIIATLALAASLLALGQTVLTHRENKRLMALAGNGSLLANCWEQLAANPKLLRFHGLTEAKLAEEGGITRKELSYLLCLFEAATFYYEHADQRENEPFEKESLRYKLLESPDTQKAWKVLEPFFIADGIYTNRVNRTIRKINAERKRRLAAQNGC